jgi:hypothetical protein
VLAAGALVVTGCGGGGGDAPTNPTSTGGGPATTTAGTEEAAAAVEAYRAELRDYASELRSHTGKKLQRRALARLAGSPPKLEALETDDPGYATAQASAADVDDIAAELALTAGSDEKADAKLYNRLYSVSADAWQRSFDRGNQHFDRLSPIVHGPNFPSPKTERTVRRIWVRYMVDVIRLWRKYDRQIAGVPARTDLYRSFVAYQRASTDEAIAFQKRFLQYMRDTPIKFQQFGYYTAQATKFSSYEIAVPVMWRRDQALIRGFVRDVGRIALGRDAAVGDAYRRVIVNAFASPLKKLKFRSSIVSQQLWMLWRIRELEDTPDDVYEDARQTILLQGIDDVRNPYARLLEVYNEADGDLSAGERKPKPELKRFLAWADEELDRPTAPILEPTVEQVRRGFDRFPKVRSDVLFKTLDDLVAAQKWTERRLRWGAKRVDDPKQLKAATREAVEATRPEPGT